MPNDRIPTIAEVDQIAALADPIIRNLQITQAYHELALVLAERTGLSANWCTFATWASKQAGVTIRKEDLARALERRRGAGRPTRPAAQDGLDSTEAIGARTSGALVEQVVWQAWNPLEAFDRVSDAVARGNRKVFEEIGRAFARFYEACPADAAFDADRISRFCEELKPGDPPEGQRYLRQAFARYYQALFEQDPKTRAELLLLANIEVGYHEQTRLQPEITEALDAPAPDAGAFKRLLAAAIFRQGNWLALAAWLWARVVRRPTPLDAAAERIAAELQHQARLITTEYLMTIELPGGQRLRLGDDLAAEYPTGLQHLTNAELLALLARIDPTPDSTRGTGTADWADLPQRLHFILDMFRCYAEAQDLFKPPFTSEELAALKAGHWPAAA
jgi:hypothetical protein